MSYLRDCRFNIVKNCKKVFKTESKCRRLDFKICKRCKKRLKQLKISVKRYLKMSENKAKEEKIEWIEKNKATVSITESIPIKNDKGEVIGESEMKNTHIATREDFEKGLELISEQADNLKSKIRKLDEQIKSFGKKPVMTGEMARIEKAMEGIMKLRQIKKLEADKSNQHEQLESLEKMRKRNSDALKNAPK